MGNEDAARFVERFAMRLAEGPAVKERSAPINHVRYTPEEVGTIVPLLNGLASCIRAGFEPEAGWPDTLEVTNPAPGLHISTCDPAFDPDGAVIVNGYRFERAPSLPPMAMTINPSEA